MTLRKGFGALILTHGRPESVKMTIGALDRCGYTGPWWLVLDSGDESAQEYRDRWGDEKVIVFDKKTVTLDVGDNEPTMRGVVYARNATDGIASNLGLTHYVVLDDDYRHFSHRVWVDGEYLSIITRRLDDVFEAHLRFLDSSGAATVALAQGGDYIGGKGGKAARSPMLRKAMNSFFLRVGKPVPFMGRINEDVNMYVTLGMRGEKIFTVPRFYLGQEMTQQQSGGLTEQYLDSGTYIKSFYTVMMAPSCTGIRTMGNKDRRTHHEIRWNNAVPKILSDKWRKAR